MTRLGRVARRGVAIAFSLALPFGAIAQETRIPLDQSPVVVENLLAAGQANAAYEIALAAYRVEPDNTDFMIALARTEISRGNFQEAIRLASRAYREGQLDGTKYIAANTVAQAHYALKNLTRAQIWLRRAYQFAPNDDLAAAAAKNFGDVRSQNPFSTQLSFGITPSSNINNGSASDTALFYGLEFPLSGDARALSGIEFSGSVNTRYQLQASNTSATFLTASASAQTYMLSKAAQEQAPGVLGRDYSYGVIAVGARHNQILTEGGRPTEFSIRASKAWYGTDPYSHSFEASITHAWKLNETDKLVGTVTGQRTFTLSEKQEGMRKFTVEIPSTTFSLSGRWLRAYDNGNDLSLGADFRRNNSAAGDSDYQSVTYLANLDLAKPVSGMRFGFGFDYESRDYDFSTFANGPREDRSLGLNMTVNFADVEFYGFQPVVNLEARRNESSYDLFDRNYGTIGFDLRSSF